jgi:hypothetical protein
MSVFSTLNSTFQYVTLSYVSHCLNYIILVVIVSALYPLCVVCPYCFCSFVCCVSFECGVLFCVMCVICVLCLIVVPLPPGKNLFVVKINNSK